MQARMKSSAAVMLGGVGMVVMTLSMGTPAQNKRCLEALGSILGK